jgi:muramoyltetrapeptide carboxypeptidase
LPRLLKARGIRPGATLGIAAPAGPVDPETLRAGEDVWRRAGFEVRRRDDLLARDGYLAGDDERRANELMELWRDPSIDAIVCARGGYGTPRILARLDPGLVREARKPLVGYSDITALLLWQRRRAGLVGFHGPMLERGSDVDGEMHETLVATLVGRRSDAQNRLAGTGRLPGRGEGRLVGGNLVLCVASLGTPWEIDTRGAILLIEEVGERPYRIDRMLAQLRAAGKLDRLVGIGLGDVSTCIDERFPKPAALSVVEEAARRAGVPLVTDLPFGHCARNSAFGLGVRATIDGAEGEIRMLEQGVVRAS